MLFPFQLQCPCFENKMGKAVNSSRSRPCSPATTAPQAPTLAGSAELRHRQPCPSPPWVLMRERSLHLRRKLCHPALPTTTALVGTAQFCTGAASSSMAVWDQHSSQVRHALLGTCRARPSSQMLSRMCGCIPGHSWEAAPLVCWQQPALPHGSDGDACPPSTKDNLCSVPACSRLVGERLLVNQPGAGAGRGRGSAWGCGSSRLQPSHVSCNFNCSCPQADGDKHGATVLCVSCDLSSARVCLALRISHE